MAARYILFRIAEEFGISATLKPQILENYESAKLYINFSTLASRANNGYEAIKVYLEKLAQTHQKMSQLYAGELIKDLDLFSFGVGSRAASIRVPTTTKTEGKGHVEDRRPSSNANPYIVTSSLVDVLLQEGKESDEMNESHQEWKRWKLKQPVFNFL